MMVAKVFGVASVLSVAALTLATALAGCSSDDPVATGAADAKADRTPVTVDDAGSTQCYSDDPVDATQVAYSSPGIQVGACTTANVAELVAYIKANAEATFADLQTHVKATYSATCASCIFTDFTATQWGPILTSSAEAGAVVGVNGGGCIEIVSGRGNACGKAYYQWSRCIDFACDTCADTADYQACSTAVQDPASACGDASAALLAGCGSSVQAYINACQGTYGIDEWINCTCVVGSSISDAGTDGGDGGDGGDGAVPPGH